MGKSKVAGTIVRALVKRDENLLLVQTRRTEKRNEWELPGGKVKKGESLVGAAHRELKEETSLVLMRAKKVIDWKRETPFRTFWRFVVFDAIEARGIVAINDTEEIYKAQWFPFTDLPTLDEQTNTIFKKFNIEL